MLCLAYGCIQVCALWVLRIEAVKMCLHCNWWLGGICAVSGVADGLAVCIQTVFYS